MTAAMLRLPMTAVLLTTLFLGSDGFPVMPLTIVAVVVAYVTANWLSASPRPRPLPHSRPPRPSTPVRTCRLPGRMPPAGQGGPRRATVPPGAQGGSPGTPATGPPGDAAAGDRRRGLRRPGVVGGPDVPPVPPAALRVCRRGPRAPRVAFRTDAVPSRPASVSGGRVAGGSREGHPEPKDAQELREEVG